MRLKTKGMLKRIGVLFMLFVLSITMMCGTQTAFGPVADMGFADFFCYGISQTGAAGN